MWRVFIIHVSSKAFGDASYKTWVFGNTPLLFPRRGCGEVVRGEKRCGEMPDFDRINRLFSQNRQRVLEKRGEHIPEHVYHYTAVNNLEHFYKGGTDILATHVAVLNDCKEITTGVELFLACLEERYSNQDKTNELREQYFATRTQPGKMPYIFSLSSEKNSLSQWRAYTDIREGGYSIQFSAPMIDSCVKRNMCGEDHCGWMEFFGPCLYSKRDACEEFVRNATIEFSDIFDAYFFAKDNELVSKNQAVELMVILSAFIKDEGFWEEHEWRVVVKPGQIRNKFTDDDVCDRARRLGVICCLPSEKTAEKRRWKSAIEVIGGKPRVATRLRNVLGDIPPMIEGIEVSPHGNRDKLITISQALKCNYGIAFMPLTASKIPYRADR